MKINAKDENTKAKVQFLSPNSFETIEEKCLSCSCHNPFWPYRKSILLILKPSLPIVFFLSIYVTHRCRRFTGVCHNLWSNFFDILLIFLWMMLNCCHFVFVSCIFCERDINLRFKKPHVSLKFLFSNELIDMFEILMKTALCTSHHFSWVHHIAHPEFLAV